MNPPVNPLVQIVVTNYPAVVVKQTPRGKRLKKAAVAPLVTTKCGAIRQRFSAEFVGGSCNGLSVTGCLSPTEALGTLLRAALNTCETADECFDLLASFFGDLKTRSPEATLARALREHLRRPGRKHPGLSITMPDMQHPSLDQTEGGAA